MNIAAHVMKDIIYLKMIKKYVKKIYYRQHNPIMTEGDYTMQVHFAWNNFKRKMVPIKGLYYIDYNIAKTYNNEYLQSII